MHKVLIANRGEIAVRIVRACRDAGLVSVAVYAEPDLDALHVALADEAFALGGSTPARSYLDIAAVVGAGRAAGADAVHPGYGFLAENADFAEAVLDAGLTWIGPPPATIRALGDKTAARHLARKVGAPLAPGTTEPVGGVAEVLAFAEEHGLPIAIKAAYGGGGRGLKVAHELGEVPELFDAAVREAVAAFGRGECFVERYLEAPRHVETQVLADAHGSVVVLGTRDCSLQRRYQKLVEEAPAPNLTQAQRATIYDASRAICLEAGYVGAGTCEFLLGGDGMISFLEVNTRLQVEHPVTEETTGIDIVRAQLEIAAGDRLTLSDPVPHGHSMQFRINGEDAGRGFVPTPGTITAWRPPSGPGIRLDSGVEVGTAVGAAFDSLLAKLIVTGATREQALQRARRALDEFVCTGLPTTIAFHRAVVRDPAFTAVPFGVHNTWIETEFDNQVPPYDGADASDEGVGPPPRERIVVEVAGRRLEVVVPAELRRSGAAAAEARTPPVRRPARRSGPAASVDTLTSPMQGTIVAVAVTNGQRVEAGELVVVLEAMKMEQPIRAHKTGVVTELSAQVGASVRSGAVICSLHDE